MIPSAIDRRRSNQFTIAIVNDMNPDRAAPIATKKNATKKNASESTWLKSMNPPPKITTPICDTIRGPNRSINRPCTGPSTPLSACDIENAAENIVLLQPNSSRITAA